MATTQQHNFIKHNQEIKTFDDIKPYYTNLLERPLSSKSQVWQWLLDWSELDCFVCEDFAWRYIKSTIDTNDTKAIDNFDDFVSNIEPEITTMSNKISQRFLQDNVQLYIDKAQLFTMIRDIKNDIELFCEENLPIETEIQQTTQKYNAICSQMSVDVDNKKMTIQQANNYIKTAPRGERKRVWELVSQRQLADSNKINELLSNLISLRNQMATNAGCNNYIDYRFKQLCRFDYTPADCFDFHNSIEKVVMPLLNDIHLRRKKLLQVDTLRPYDLAVDLPLGVNLKPFSTIDDLITKTMWCLRDIAPEFGMMINSLKSKGHLDLESRIGKAPGGYNYPLFDSNSSFIFMNATNDINDMTTLLHESGHAIHAALCSKQPLFDHRETPAEIAELASMSMELISMAHWHYFFKDETELKIAKLTQLESVIAILPWIAAIDKFQHYLYTTPNHTVEQRTQAWLDIMAKFASPVVDYSGYDEAFKNRWQRQLHIFETPLYYIEYGFAQLGAISIWKNYTENPQTTIDKYKKALALGYSRPIPEIYKTAGIDFCFTTEYISNLMDFVKNEIDKLC